LPGKLFVVDNVVLQQAGVGMVHRTCFSLADKITGLKACSGNASVRMDFDYGDPAMC